VAARIPAIRATGGYAVDEISMRFPSLPTRRAARRSGRPTAGGRGLPWLAAVVLGSQLAAPPVTAAMDEPQPPVAVSLAAWEGAFGGVPPFDRVTAADLAPALEAAMAEKLRAVEAIVANPEPPTFTNTIVALEQAGRPLANVLAIHGVFTGSLSDDAVRQVERDMAPRLAAFADRITQHEPLFRRIQTVFENLTAATADAEQLRLTWLTFTGFTRAGAALDVAAKQELSDINSRLATLSTTFAQNVLADETDRVVLVEAEAELAGLPESLVTAAAAAARGRGATGWALANTRSVVEPVLTFGSHRPLRERVWRMFVERGAGGSGTDNHPIIREIVALRARRAALLGYPTHAHWALEHSMAATPERAVALMEQVWRPAVAAVHRDVAAMQALADADAAGITIEPWDYRFYSERLRQAHYDFDDTELTPYLQLELLREGMFEVAARLFDLYFTPVPDGSVPVPHPDIRVWQVRRGDGTLAGLWYFDPFARPGKRSGAWMAAYRPQSSHGGEVTALVSNTCNFTPGPPGMPVTISWTDATTLFHEFGHALHGLCSQVRYPSLSGTRVARDYVEFPSQLLEHWLSVPETLATFTRHVETGAPLPPELVAKIDRASRHGEGFRTVEFLASGLLDMRLHMGAAPDDPAAFEREALAALGMPREVVMRHRLPHFNHVFAGGYAAAYYSYLWADVLTADAWEAFIEGAGPWDDAVAERLRRHVLSAGNTVDPADGYRAFRGRDPDTAALMRKRGFTDRGD
jgi:peptidyl-dipeptidase Dcp